METLRERVIEARTRLGKSQSQIAREIGVKPQAIQSLESGRTRSFRALVPLAEALSVSPRWLATGEGPKTLTLDATSADLAAAMEDFATRIRDARQSLQLPISIAARGIMPEADWARMERAEFWPLPMQLDLLCGRLMQSLDWLVRGIVIASGERPVASSRGVMLHEPPPPIRRGPPRCE